MEKILTWAGTSCLFILKSLCAFSGIRNPSVSTFIHGLTPLGPRLSRVSSFRILTTISYNVTNTVAQLMLHNDVHIHSTLFFACLMPLCFYLEALNKQSSLVICLKECPNKIFSLLSLQKKKCLHVHAVQKIHKL